MQMLATLWSSKSAQTTTALHSGRGNLFSYVGLLLSSGCFLPIDCARQRVNRVSLSLSRPLLSSLQIAAE